MKHRMVVILIMEKKMRARIRFYEGKLPASVMDAVAYAQQHESFCVAVHDEQHNKFTGSVAGESSSYNTENDDLWAIVETDKVIAALKVGYQHDADIRMSTPIICQGGIINIDKLSFVFCG